MNWEKALVVFVGISVAWTPSADAGNSIEFEAFRQSDGGPVEYYAEFIGRVSGFTGVQWWDVGTSQWVDLHPDEDEDDFYLGTDHYSTLAELNISVGGERQIRVLASPADYAAYTLTINPFVISDFPVMAVLDAVTAPVSGSHEFTWTWGGNLNDIDTLFLEAYIATDYGYLDVYSNSSVYGDLLLDATSAVVDFTPHAGTAMLLLGYGAVVDGIVTDWTYDAAGSTIADVFDLAGDDRVLAYAESEAKLAGVVVLGMPGDADLDGDVDLDDFVILKQNFSTGTTWGEGDFDLDGDVDLDDFVILKKNFATAAIPEPSSAALIVVAVLWLRRRR